jgi:hypothetical protein
MSLILSHETAEIKVKLTWGGNEPQSENTVQGWEDILGQLRYRLRSRNR